MLARADDNRFSAVVVVAPVYPKRCGVLRVIGDVGQGAVPIAHPRANRACGVLLIERLGFPCYSIGELTYVIRAWIPAGAGMTRVAHRPEYGGGPADGACGSICAHLYHCSMRPILCCAYLTTRRLPAGAAEPPAGGRGRAAGGCAEEQPAGVWPRSDSLGGGR